MLINPSILLYIYNIYCLIYVIKVYKCNDIKNTKNKKTICIDL